MDLHALIESMRVPEVIAPAGTGLVGLLVGWLVARAHASWGKGKPDSREDVNLHEALRDLRRNVYLLQNENGNLSTFLRTLPDLARQLNSNVGARQIPEMLISFIERLFSVEQIHIFLTMQEGDQLKLVHGKGFPDELKGRNVPFGHGRIGWAAENQATMDDKDFRLQAPTLPPSFDGPAAQGFRTELCAPMVSNEETLGVISLGGLLRRPKNDKKMLKMIADFASIAMQNARLLSMFRASANTDGLTGLSNKRHLLTQMAEEIIRAEEEGTPLSLFMFDIDHFKIYNDTNGHLSGDEALRITGKLIRSNIRQEDFAARYGGEEFVVLLPATDKEGAVRAAEKIRQSVEQYAYPQEASQPSGRVTVSGGVATFPIDGKNSAELIRHADEALYEGKRSGRNSVQAYKTVYLSGDQPSDAPPTLTVRQLGEDDVGKE